MKPIEFPESQRKAGQIPVYEQEGNILCCWQGGFIERLRFLFTGKIWLWFEAKSVPSTGCSTEKPLIKPEGEHGKGN